MNSSAHNSLWEMIDGVLVINLDQRVDRWAQFQEAARGNIPPEKLQRLPARLGLEIPGFGERPWFRGRKRDNTWAGRAGCVQSHRRALTMAREAGWRVVMLLEDDVEFAPEFSALSESFAAVLRDNEWQVCYLGFTEPWSPGRKLASLDHSHSLQQIHGCTTTHAYLVRAEARDWILSQLPDEKNIWGWLATHRAIDRWYQRQLGLRFQVACVSPGLVNQAAGFSDIAARRTDSSAEDRHTHAAVVSSAGKIAYSFRRALRKISVRIGLAGDVLRGRIRRVQGF